jgi:hypothetical protein
LANTKAARTGVDKRVQSTAKSKLASQGKQVKERQIGYCKTKVAKRTTATAKSSKLADTELLRRDSD